MALRSRPVAALGALAILLTGCVTIGTKQKTVPNLLTLVASISRPVASDQSPTPDQAISIALPFVPQHLSYNRIPVISAAGRISFIADTNWVEPPAALFRALLSEVLGARTGHVVIDARALPINAGTRLSGQLQAFGVDENTHEAVVTYDALLVRKGTTQIAARRFSARARIGAITGPAAGAALNEAANQVALQVADWVKAAT